MSHGRSLRSIALVVAVMSWAAPLGAKERIKLAVLDMRSKGVDAELVANLTDIVTVSLNKLGVFDVLSRADIQQMLAFEEDKQFLGCESDTSCLAEVGGALGVALLVTGSIGKVGQNYIVNLSLTDTKTVEVMAREQRQVASEDELTANVEGAARFLVRGLLEGQQGFLILKATETGADVEIDGRLVGVTPLPRQTLAGGPHTLKVIKTGFITWASDIDIQQEQAAVVDAALVPSLEFINDYEARASTWRIAAYSAGGAGLAGLGTGIGLWLWNNGRARVYEDELEDANCHEGATGDPVSSCSGFDSRRDSIRQVDLLAQIAGGVGLAALGAAVYLFVQGPEPGVYDDYRPAASISVVPTSTGVTALGLVRF